jgi:hypothetical protein
MWTATEASDAVHVAQLALFGSALSEGDVRRVADYANFW